MFGIGKTTSAHVSELLSAYIDNQLNGREHSQVEAHLRQCPACAEELRLLQATVQTLRALPAAPLPRSFVLQPVVQPQRVQPLELFLRLATVATAIALFLSIGGEMIQPALAPGREPLQMQASPASETVAAPMAKVAAEQPSAPGAGTPMVGAAMAPTEDAQLRSAPAKTPVPPPLAAPVPLATAPADAERSRAPAPSPTAQPRVMLAEATPSPAPAPDVAESVAPTATAGPAAPDVAPPMATPAPTLREPPLRPIQIGLASLLAALIGATAIVRRKR